MLLSTCENVFTARPPFGQKIVPIFWPGNLNYDKIFERGTTRLWVILIMGRGN
jgi:hypothetical protein